MLETPNHGTFENMYTKNSFYSSLSPHSLRTQEAYCEVKFEGPFNFNNMTQKSYERLGL